MENNFEDKLKALLHHPPELSVDEEAWANITRQMDHPLFTKNRNRRWIWLPILLAIMSLSAMGGYFFSKHQFSDLLNTKLAEQKIGKKTIIYDTLIQKHISIIYDTIYQKNVIPYPVYQNSNQIAHQWIPNFQTSSFAKFSSKEENSTENNFLSSNRDKKIDWQNYYLENNSNPINLADNKTLKHASSSFENGKFLLDKRMMRHIENILPLSIERMQEPIAKLPSWNFYTAKRKNYLYAMRPTRLALRAAIGYGYDFSLDLYDLRQTNKIFGIELAIGFGKNWNLIIGGDLRKQNFRVETERNGEGLNLERFFVIPPQDINDELKRIDGRVEYLEVPFGFSYSFLRSEKFQSYLGIGLTSQKILSASTSFEYQHLENIYTLQENNFLTSEFKIKNAWGRVGMQMSLYKKWSWFAELAYQFKLKNTSKSKLEDTKLLKGNTGFSYQF